MLDRALLGSSSFYGNGPTEASALRVAVKQIELCICLKPVINTQPV
jgi:hypothetical protein